MRGQDETSGRLFSYIGIEARVPSGHPLRALPLQAFYPIRSERRSMERLDFNLLFGWFVGLGLDDAVWDASTFCKNRDRLLAAAMRGRGCLQIVGGRVGWNEEKPAKHGSAIAN